jgi:hypothetical protein
MFRRIVLVAATVMVIMVALGPNLGGSSAAAADLAGRNLSGAQSGFPWYADCSLIGQIWVKYDLRVNGGSGVVRARTFVKLNDVHGEYQYIAADTTYSSPPSGSQTYSEPLAASSSLSAYIPQGSGQCGIQFWVDTVAGSPTVTFDLANVVIRTFPKPTGGGPGGSPGPEASGTTNSPGPSPSASPDTSLDGVVVCHWQPGGSGTNAMEANGGTCWWGSTYGQDEAPNGYTQAALGDGLGVGLSAGPGDVIHTTVVAAWGGRDWPANNTNVGGTVRLTWHAATVGELVNQSTWDLGSEADFAVSSYGGLTIGAGTEAAAISLSMSGVAPTCWGDWPPHAGSCDFGDTTVEPNGAGVAIHVEVWPAGVEPEPPAPPSGAPDPFAWPSGAAPTPTPVPPMAGGPGGDGGDGADQCVEHPATVGCLPNGSISSPQPNVQEPGDGIPDGSPVPPPPYGPELDACNSTDPTTKVGYIPYVEEDEGRPDAAGNHTGLIAAERGLTGWLSDNLGIIGDGANLVIEPLKNAIGWTGDRITGAANAARNTFLWFWNTADNAIVPNPECLGQVIEKGTGELDSQIPFVYLGEAADVFAVLASPGTVAGPDDSWCMSFDVFGGFDVCVEAQAVADAMPGWVRTAGAIGVYIGFWAWLVRRIGTDTSGSAYVMRG